MPSEQPREGTRVKVVFTRAEAEALLLASDGYFSPDATNLGLGANKIAAALEPAQPQPRGEGDDLAARLERRADAMQQRFQINGGEGEHPDVWWFREAASTLTTYEQALGAAEAMERFIRDSRSLLSLAGAWNRAEAKLADFGSARAALEGSKQ